MALYESRLTDSLGPVNAKTLARDIARDKPLDIPAWLEARNVTLLGDKAVSVLNDLYAEAGWVGVCLARAELDYARTLGKADNPELSVDWSGWVPGDPDAARLLLSEAGTGLRGLLDRAAITIKGVNDSRVSELGNLLARTVGEGASMRTTAAAIREQFGTGNKWSKTVAQTETRRAVTAASVDTYQGAGVGSVEWLTAWGEACPICQEFQDMGPVLIGSGAFDGDDGPPGHPNCFCVILPVIDPEMLRPVDETLDIEEIGEEVVKPEDGRRTSFDEWDVQSLLSESGEGDAMLRRILSEQGFDGLPQVIDKFDDADNVMYRGLAPSVDGRTAADLAEQFRTGDLYIGDGMWGNGTYLTNNEKYAWMYAGDANGAVMEVRLAEGARVIDAEDLKKMLRDMRLDPNFAVSDLALILRDPGRAAAMMGYDAIVVNDGIEVVVLNRRMAIVAREMNIDPRI